MSGNEILVIAVTAGGVILIYSAFKMIQHLLKEESKTPIVSIVLIVKNQEQIIEGILREIYACSCKRCVKVYVIDKNSEDQTKNIIERLKRRYPQLCEVEDKNPSIDKEPLNLSREEYIYYMDLTTPVNYRLLLKTIQGITGGTDTCLYRTRFMGKYPEYF